MAISAKNTKKRLEGGLKIILNKKASNIILCSETANEDIKNYLIKKGVSEKNIILQDKSGDSIGEAFFTKKYVLVPNNWKDIIVLSSDYHIRYRIGIIFDFILGNDFNIEYVGVESGRLKDSETIKDQIRSLYNFTKEFIGIEPGDDQSIEGVMLKQRKVNGNDEGL